MDRGYANFEVESTQVAIAPEKDDIFITVNVNEGEVFKVKEVKLAGTFVVPEPLLRRYLLVQPGDTFSRKIITATQELLQNRLGEDGFAFAKVDPVPTTMGDPNNKELSLTFFVDPGNRVYVRHIVFNGVTKINDEVLRREMRQLEGGWLSNAALDRSKQRLERLPYITKVESETKPVAGSTDLVDVTYKIEEGPSAQLGGGIGYSESQSFILSGNYADANFLGTGRRVSVDLNSGKYSKVYGMSVTEPYFTAEWRRPHRQRHLSRPDAVRVGVIGLLVGDHRRGLRRRLSDRREPGHSHGTAVPEVEPAHQRRRQRAPVDHLGGAATAIHTRECIDYDTDDPFVRRRACGAPNTTRSSSTLPGTTTAAIARCLPIAACGTRSGWPMRCPDVSDVEYYVASYEFIKYVPLFGRFTLQLGADLAYGMDIGETTALPPYRQFYGGGPETVRGYKESRLGPKDDFGRPFGGNLKVVGRAEVIIPLPQKFQSSARLSWFYDIGNIFSTGDRYLFLGRAAASRSSTSSSMIN